METIDWISPKTITGPPAEGVRYLRRENINSEFWNEIQKGSHILVSSPRRIGKTSILRDLAGPSKKEGFLCIFQSIEADKTSLEFYQRLYFLILNELSILTQAKKKVINWLESRGIEEISLEGGIKFKTKELNFKAELLDLIKQLPLFEQHLVFFLDEFSEVISSIRRSRGDEEAIEILHTLREIRQNMAYRHCTFVFAGSIGLEHIVDSLERRKLINDLHIIRVPSLTKDEAWQLITQITKGATMQLSDDVITSILTKLEILIPYFIQCMIEECDAILRAENRPKAEKMDVDKAYDKIVRNNPNLIDFETRLKSPYLPKDQNKFCISILTMAAHRSNVTIQEIFNESRLLEDPDGYMNILEMLIHDGYLQEISEGSYRFASPLLGNWWKRNHPVIELK
jgi:uncharacterized protein